MKTVLSILFTLLVTSANAEVLPPKGFIQFCDEHNCNIRSQEEPLYVHHDVNKKIKLQDDIEEYWDYMPYYGDCDDFAISKWYRSDKFNLMVMLTPDATYHLVVTKDGYIYDYTGEPIKIEVHPYTPIICENNGYWDYCEI